MSTDREKQTGANTAGQSELIEPLGATCGECGSDMEIVRPGKWQCTKCELDAMLDCIYAKGFSDAVTKAIGICSGYCNSHGNPWWPIVQAIKQMKPN